MGKVEQFQIRLFPAPPPGQPQAPDTAGQLQAPDTADDGAKTGVVAVAGQPLAGKVEVLINEPIKIKELKVKFFGEAKVRWTDQEMTTQRQSIFPTDHDGKLQPRTVTNTGEELYFDETQVLLNLDNASAKKGKDVVLNPGNYTFDFTYTIPAHCPSSFEGSQGHIRYYVSSTMAIPWRFDKKSRQPFTVVSHLDLNALPQQIKKPVCVVLVPCAKSWFRASGLVTLSAQVPRGGYVCGERVPVSVQLHNKSSKTVVGTKAKLIQVARYHSKGKTKEERVAVAEVEGEGCAPKGPATWDKVPLEVPPVPQSARLRVLDIEYLVEVGAHIEGTHSLFKVELPITIGTVPLWEAVQAATTLPAAPAAPSAPPAPTPPIASTAPTAPPLLYPQLPPPSYSESVSGAVNTAGGAGGEAAGQDDSHTYGQLTYTPLYPSYAQLFGGCNAVPHAEPPPAYTPSPEAEAPALPVKR